MTGSRNLRGPFYGCPYVRDPVILGQYQVPLILGNSCMRWGCYLVFVINEKHSSYTVGSEVDVIYALEALVKRARVQGTPTTYAGILRLSWWFLGFLCGLLGPDKSCLT